MSNSQNIIKDTFDHDRDTEDPPAPWPGDDGFGGDAELVPDRIEGGVEPKLPIYLVIDRSLSMRPVIAEMSDLLPGLGNELRANPLIAQTAIASVITFATDATLDLSRRYLADGSLQFPDLAPNDATNYDAALTLLRDTIKGDMAHLKTVAGPKHYRPLVFFITDGNPNVGGDWRATWNTFCAPGSESAYRPIMVPIGFGSVNDSVLNELTNVGCAYKASTTNPTAIVEGIKDLIFHTTLTAFDSATTGTPQPAPAAATGFINVGFV